MTKKPLTINPNAKAERERKAAIEKERPTYAIRHGKTREEIWPENWQKWFAEQKFSDADIGKFFFGRPVKGFFFNTKLLLDDEALYERVLKKREKAAREKAEKAKK